MRGHKSFAFAMSATSVIAKTRTLFVTASYLMLSLVAASSTASASTILNGPVNITVGANAYETYYSTTEYYRVLEN